MIKTSAGVQRRLVLDAAAARHRHPAPQFPPPLLDRVGLHRRHVPDPIVTTRWYPTGSVPAAAAQGAERRDADPARGPPLLPELPRDGRVGVDVRLDGQHPRQGAALQGVRRPRRRSSRRRPNRRSRRSRRRCRRRNRDSSTSSTSWRRCSFADVWATRMPAETYDQQVISAHAGPGQFLTAAQCNACHNATPQSPLLPNMVQVEEQAGAHEPAAQPLAVRRMARLADGPVGSRPDLLRAAAGARPTAWPTRTACIERHLPALPRRDGRAAVRRPTRRSAGRRPRAPTCSPSRRRPRCRSASRSGATRCSSGRARRRTTSSSTARSARDGVSCTVCHHVAATDLGEERTYTGNFVTGPAEEIYGPVQGRHGRQPSRWSMRSALTPMYGEQIAALGALRQLSQHPAADLRQRRPTPRRVLRAVDPPGMDQQRQRPSRRAVPLLPGLPHADRLQGRRARVQDRQQRVERSSRPRPIACPTRTSQLTTRNHFSAPLAARAERLPEPVLPAVPAAARLPADRLDVGAAVAARPAGAAVLAGPTDGAAAVHRLRVDAGDGRATTPRR